MQLCPGPGRVGGAPQPCGALDREPSEAFMNSCIQGSSDTWGRGAASGQTLGRPPPTYSVSLWQSRKTCSSHLPQVGVSIFILGYRTGAPRKPSWVFPPLTPSPSVPGALPIPCIHPPATLPGKCLPTTGDVPLEGAPKGVRGSCTGELRGEVPPIFRRFADDHNPFQC